MLRPQRPHNLRKIPTWQGPKPPLLMDVTYVCRVHYHTLEQYLAKVYRMEGYNIQLATGSRFGMIPEYTVTGNLPAAPNIQQIVDNIRRGRRTRKLGLILDLLCSDGFIPAGTYLIDMTEEVQPIKRYAELLHNTQDSLHEMCIALREANKGDIAFIKQANNLDRQLLDHQARLAAKIHGVSRLHRRR